MNETIKFGTDEVKPYESEICKDGANNLLEAIAERAAKDYIRGYMILKKTFKRIPTEKEFNKYIEDRDTTGRNNIYKKMAGYYESRNYIISDPWGMFDMPGESICKSLDKLADQKIVEKSKREMKNIKKLHA